MVELTSALPEDRVVAGPRPRTKFLSGTIINYFYLFFQIFKIYNSKIINYLSDSYKMSIITITII